MRNRHSHAIERYRVDGVEVDAAIQDECAVNLISTQEAWTVDVEAYERAEPRVTLQESPGAGTGVFAAEDLKEGSTATEYVGLLAECPDTRSGDLALYQSYYGENWRKYCQRYEIGLTGARVADAVGRAKGGSVVAGSLKTTCDVDEDLDACVTRAGEGEYVLLGKVERATVDEGVAQLINDHSTIRAPSHLTPSEGSLRPSDVDGFVLKDSATVPCHSRGAFVYSRDVCSTSYSRRPGPILR